MGLELRFLPYTSGDSDGVEIYRADSLEGERKKLVALDPGIHNFNDRSVEANRIYWYWILSKAASGDKLSRPMSAPTFLDMGPGPTTLLRGDWAFGYMGFVPVNQLFSYGDVKMAAGISVDAQASSPLTGFHKCAVNGRILFIGDQLYSPAVTAANLGFALLPSGSDVADAKAVTVNGNDFLIRCPYATTAHTTEVTGLTAPDATLSRSEIGMLASLIIGIDTAQLYRELTFSDMVYNNLTDGYFSNTYSDSNKVLAFSLAPTASVGTVSDMTQQRPFWPVFELVLHD